MTTNQDPEQMIAWLPDLLFTGGRFERGSALVCDASGIIAGIARADELRDEKRVRLSRRALLSGMVNAHSHAFQRVLRGRTEYRTRSTPFSGGLLPAPLGRNPTPKTESARGPVLTWRARMLSP